MKQLIKERLRIKLSEAIRAEEAYTNQGSIQTLIDKKRNVAFIAQVGAMEAKMINDNNLKAIKVPSNPHNTYIVFNDGHEKEANELLNIAEKYDGYLAYYASEEDVRKIGKLLDYADIDVENFIQKNKQR